MQKRSPSGFGSLRLAPEIARPQFRIDATQRAGAFVIYVEGDLNVFELPRLEEALDEAELSEATQILLDLDDLTFIDASGLHALRAASRRSVRNGNRLRVTRGRGIVADMFRLTALDQTLPFATAGPSGPAAGVRADPAPAI